MLEQAVPGGGIGGDKGDDGDCGGHEAEVHLVTTMTDRQGSVSKETERVTKPSASR